eukprot:2879074-Karenia_brevis.AAC.1
MVKEVYVPEIFEPLGVPRSQLELRFPSVTFNERFKKYFAMDMVHSELHSKYIPMVRTCSKDIGGASGASGGRGRGGRGRGGSSGRGGSGGRGRGRGVANLRWRP